MIISINKDTGLKVPDCGRSHLSRGTASGRQFTPVRSPVEHPEKVDITVFRENYSGPRKQALLDTIKSLRV